MRRRNGNTFGACDLMAELVRRYAIHSEEAEHMGVDYNDIRATLKQCPGGASMGPYLDRLVKHRNLPNVQRALSSFRLRLVHTPRTKKTRLVGHRLREQSGRTSPRTTPAHRCAH